MKFAVAAMLASFVLLCAAGRSSAAEAPARSEFHQTYPLSASGSVTVDNAAGAVHVIGWDKAMVQVDATLCAPDPNLLKSLKIAVSNSTDALSVKTSSTQEPWGWPFWTRLLPSGSPCSERPEIDYLLHVPSRARVSLRSTSGDLQVIGIGGPLNLANTSGDITAQKVGDVSAADVSGDVTVTGSQGMCDVRETSGSTLLHGVSGSVTANSVSGDVDLYQVMGKAVVSSTSGSITARAFSGIARFRSTSGDISITLVRGSGVALSASTIAGTLLSDVPMRTQAPVDARTVSGDISVHFI